jgi:hypothetical protein
MLAAMDRLMSGVGAWRRAGERTVCLVALGLALTGCAGTPGAQDDTMERLLAAPDKYNLYNCEQLAQAAKVNETRQRELEALIAQAGPGTAGSLVSATAYKPEYYQLRGQMNEMRRTAAEKNCKFVPGEASPAGPSAARTR